MLEHEADGVITQRRQLITGQRTDVGAINCQLAAGGNVQRTDHVHQRGLARAGRPHDGNELTAVNLERHIVQRMHLLLAQLIGFTQVAGRDHRHR